MARPTRFEDLRPENHQTETFLTLNSVVDVITDHPDLAVTIATLTSNAATKGFEVKKEYNGLTIGFPMTEERKAKSLQDTQAEYDKQAARVGEARDNPDVDLPGGWSIDTYAYYSDEVNLSGGPITSGYQLAELLKTEREAADVAEHDAAQAERIEIEAANKATDKEYTAWAAARQADVEFETWPPAEDIEAIEAHTASKEN